MAGLAAARQIYERSVSTSESLWDAAKAGGTPCAEAAATAVGDLSALIARDPVAIMALATAPSAGSRRAYTFTHMVNVAALTMAQASALNIDGPLLEAFGVAALLHDIGKVFTPAEILHKPHRLTPEEFAIMKRHVVDGAAILRRTKGLSPLAAVVAFEHHLKQDLSGYPENVGPRSLNLCTLMVSIADVFDALRSHRPYRQGLATSRIRAIMDQQDNPAFNRPLLMRFVGMLGLFPVGCLVRLLTGELAVVTRERRADPMRPLVLVITDADERMLEQPILARTWLPDALGAHPREVKEPVDPLPLGIDPLSFL
jgi:putative nucleotidyltransferase with HDIG domain